MNLNCGKMPLGDTNVFSLCCFSPTGAAAIQKELQLAGVDMPVVNFIAQKEGPHYKPVALCVPSPAAPLSSFLLDLLMYFIFWRLFLWFVGI